MVFSSRDEAKEYIINNPTHILELAKDKKSYICPLCGSGSGKNGTGITTKDKRHFTCWAGCFSNSDIIDIIGLKYGITDSADKFSKAYAEYGIEIDKTEPIDNKPVVRESNKLMTEQERRIDFNNFYLEAKANIEQPAAIEYLKSRGISLETAKKHYLGYVAEWRHPKVPTNIPATPRLIIPVSQYSYLARDIRTDIPAEQEPYKKSKASAKVGASWLFNIKCINTSTKPIFIVEGEIDALSIIEAGGEAIGLGSTVNADKFIEIVKAHKPKKPLLLALDDDPAGISTKESIAKALIEANIDYYIVDVNNGTKDPNEALIKDREVFTDIVQRCTRLDPTLVDKANYDAYCNNSSLSDLDTLLEVIDKSKNSTYISTGLQSVDKILDNGLRTGLYVVGAISSLGKTTFCLQIVSYMAKQGRDVLIFSLEMASTELVAKNISRETMIADIRKTQGYSNAKSTLGIMDGRRHSKYSRIEQEVYREAIDQYRQYAGNIRIIEGVGSITVDDIKKAIEKHIYYTGNKPIVLIDYMQIMAHPTTIKHSMTDKQVTDYNIVSLKQMSRDYDIPIIGISSFNRESYTEPVNMSAFKESGAVEYTADVLIGLQYEGMDYKSSTKTDKNGNMIPYWETTSEHTSRVRDLLKKQEQKAKDLQPQQIECKVLKNRNGTRGTVNLDFYPVFNRFTERNSIIGLDMADENGFTPCIGDEPFSSDSGEQITIDDIEPIFKIKK